MSRSLPPVFRILPVLALAGFVSPLSGAEPAATSPVGSAPAPAPVQGGTHAAGEDDMTSLAKKTQDPTASLITVPLQNNFNFGYGPNNVCQYILNVQPVVPIQLNEEWKLLLRPIIPIINQPSPAPGIPSAFGLGDMNFTVWASPKLDAPVTFGFGPIVQFPTATDSVLGTGKWGAGPSAVAVYKTGAWVIGGLANHIWDTGGWGDEGVSLTTIQPFINYNLGQGWALGFAPTITANWEADSGQRWTIPVGLAVSKVQLVGKMPMKFSLGAYYNVEKPDFGADWQLQFQVNLLFPE